MLDEIDLVSHSREIIKERGRSSSYEMNIKWYRECLIWANARGYCPLKGSMESHVSHGIRKYLEPGGILTHDLRIRSTDALPAELRGQMGAGQGNLDRESR